MNYSTVEQRQSIALPEFTGECVYMFEFNKATGLPTYLQRWQKVVDAMLEGLTAEKSIFLTVDQRPVKAFRTHRRPGVHVDGCWVPSLFGHISPGSGGHVIPTPEPIIVPDPLHQWKTPNQHVVGGIEPQFLILASNILGSRVFIGDYERYPKAGGDFSHLDLSRMAAIDLKPNFVWIGDADTMLHEAISVNEDCLRTFIRLNVVN